MMLHVSSPHSTADLAANPVHDVSRKRCADAINQRKRGSQHAQLHLVQVHFPLQQRKHGEDGLPVRVIEEAAEPEHADHAPLVVRTAAIAGVATSRAVIDARLASGSAQPCVHPRAIEGRTLSAIHARIRCAFRRLLRRGKKSSRRPRSSPGCEASTGQATPISAVTGRLPSSRANPDISMRNGMPVSLVFGSPRSTASCTCATRAPVATPSPGWDPDRCAPTSCPPACKR